MLIPASAPPNTLRFATIVFILTGFGFLGNGLANARVQASPLTNQNFQDRPLIVLLNNTTDNNQPVQEQYRRYDISPEVKQQKFPTQNYLYSDTTETPSEELLTASIHGFRIEDVSKGVGYEDNGVTKILADATASIRLYGVRFSANTVIRFVTERLERGSDCDDLQATKQFTLGEADLTQYSAVSKIQLPALNGDENAYYVCARQQDTNMSWIHQGTQSWIQIKTYTPMLPLWANVIIILVLLSFSGLFSGLNLGLMSLDRTDMKIIVTTGTEKERRYARAIQPLRDNGNYLLCTLLLGNVLVNSSLTILLDGISSGLIAVIGSTVAIVIFGEIVPQAICSRHGLAVGANTVWLTKFFMLLTFPASYPISFILDKILGEEIGNVYNRERLKELIRVTHDYNDLEKDEVNIIAGALELKLKIVADVMTKLDKVFMLPTDAVLDFDTVSEIMSQGYSRVPIYDGTRNNLISVLYTKDLAFVDPDDKMPLRTICDFYSTPIMYVYETTTLDILFRDFKMGNKGHMAFAQRVNEDEKGADSYYEITGLVTMEDVIEALIQSEIHDETDVYDSIRRRRSKTQLALALTPSPASGMRWGCDNVHISPQLILAAFQYLSTSVEEFSNKMISKSILHRLLNQNLFFQIKVKSRAYIQHGDKAAIYERGKPADYFVLILEGRVQVELGKENLLFESGPFTFFGLPLLSMNQTAGIGETPAIQPEPTFVPDYTVRPIVDTTFLKISKSMYIAAKQATVFEATLPLSDSEKDDGDHFQKQIDQMLFSEGENASNNNFLRRKSSGKLLQSRGDPSYIVSNQNTFPQGAERIGRRNSEILSNAVPTPRQLIEDYGRRKRKQSLDSSIPDRSVTFQGQEKRSGEEVIKESDEKSENGDVSNNDHAKE